MADENVLPPFTAEEKEEMRTIVDGMHFFKGSSNAVILMADEGPDSDTVMVTSWFRGDPECFIENLVNMAVDMALQPNVPVIAVLDLIMIITINRLEGKVSSN